MKLLNQPACQAEMLARLTQLQPDTPRLWGRMSAAQMICHLSDAFRSVMGERQVEVPRHFSLWPLMRNFVLYVPLKWPPGVPTRPEIDQEIGGTAPTDFTADRQALIASIERFTATPRPFRFQPHPMFGRMSERDWMRWAYRHTDHHLRQFGC